MTDLVSDDFINSILDEIENMEDSNVSIAEEGKYITFSIAGGIFGISLLKAREILKMATITRVVQNGNYSQAFIRLRDRMIPVYNLRSLLGIEAISFTEQTCIIVLETWQDLKLKKFAIIVDSVREPMEIKQEDMVAVPQFLTSLGVNYLLGIAKVNGSLILLLNTETMKNLM